MKNIRPASILFLVLFFILSFVFSVFLVKLSGVTENQGLAAAAIGLGYGVMGAFILTFFAGIFIMKTTTEKVVKLNKIAGVLVLIFAVYVVIRLAFFSKEQNASPQRTPTKPSADAVSFIVDQNTDMGLGFFKPHIYDLQPIYFYGNLTPGKSLAEHFPWDSITFVQNELDQYAISYAPPILNPAHIKMDYEILLFRLLRLGKDFAEIQLSEQTGQTAIVPVQSGELILWPEFLLGVSTIEIKNPDIRIKPLEHASGVTFTGSIAFYKPVSIKNNWMEIACTDQNLNELARGWIKWRENNHILVSYSLLS
jgi:hypothetical protein